jgi:phosphatidylserine/phosphatidylglycerophosphate/cardiolipin synthase-like enzyme
MRHVFKIVLCLLCSFTPLITSAESNLPEGASYEVGFSPDGKSIDVILDAINSAHTSILVAAYSFTSKPIATALMNAHKRGVNVQVVADKKSNGTKYTATKFLANQGVPVRLNNHYAIFHHKFMVIDGDTLETGSFNSSAGAVDKNAENVLLLKHVKPIAEQYTEEWKKLWDEAEPLAAAY